MVRLHLLTLLAGLLLSLSAQAAKGPKLPIFQQVGIVPLQWTGPSTYGLEHVRTELQTLFPQVVRSSKRFRVMNDDLVAELWQSPKGREEMRNQFELGAFIGLTVISRADNVKLVARVLGPELQTYLLETDAVQRGWLVQADQKALTNRLEHLLFRLFNRIPVDVSVTSIQGPYITLSGGAEQGIERGDRVNLIRTRIKSLHPANGTWLHFDTSPLGQAKIVEVKTHTAVAKLIKLTYEDAVEVADGARIPAIATRVKFARLSGGGDFGDSGDQKTIIVPPLYQDGGQPAAGKAPANDPNRGVEQDLPAEQDLGEEGANADPNQPDAPLSGEDEVFAWDDFTIEGAAKKIIDDVTLAVGPYLWSVKGPRSLEGNFPWWLVNKGYLSVTKSVVMKIKVGYGGGILFGGTPNGRFFGYDGHARIYWEDQLITPLDFVSWWRAGGHARVNGMSVEGEKYGGGDWIKGGVFGSLGGQLIMSGTDRYDWFAEFGLMPLNIGRLGYDEKFYQVESALGQNYTLGGVRYAPPGEPRFGGRIVLENERQTLNNGRRMHFQEYSIQALMQFDL